MTYRFSVQFGRLIVEPAMCREDLLLLTPIELHSVVVAKWCCLCAYHARFPEAEMPEDAGGYTCAYCYLYGGGSGESCIDCPVYKATSMAQCWNTPYANYLDAFHKNLGREALIDACRAELAFLINLKEEL